MKLDILTPEKKLFSDDVYGVQLPGINGKFEILEKHAAIVSALGKGYVKVLVKKNEEIKINISGGFVEVLNNKITILAEAVLEV